MRYFWWGAIVLIAVPAAFFLWPKVGVLEIANLPDRQAGLPPEKIWPKPLANPPAVIKAVYATEWSGSSAKKTDYLIDLIEKTDLNAVVLDIKDYSGYLAYDPQIPETTKLGAATNRIPDLNALVEKFHAKNIYLIGRITVFQDPVLAEARPDLAVKDKNNAVWKDRKGLAWLDPAGQETWDYNVAIAKNLLKRGFDEINFDYIRFPSDGYGVDDLIYPLWDKQKTKREVIKSFFRYLRSELPNARISADVFGQTTVDSNDMGIGQVIEDAYKNFDYVGPMIYPSHFINGFMNFANPADHPYEVAQYSMTEALKRLQTLRELQKTASTTVTTSKLRPWLQVFDLGAVYTPEMIHKQIQAVEELRALAPDSFNGYFLWNPSNIYPTDVAY